VCAVARLLFDRNIGAVADLFTDLMLLPDDELRAGDTRCDLEAALTALADRVLVPPSTVRTGAGSTAAAGSAAAGGGGGGATPAATTTASTLPTLRFDRLIAELAVLAPRFALQLPPYFLNNARALATLEGMARSADPSFDVLQAVYPFALRRLLADPTGSPRLRRTLDALTRDADGRIAIPGFYDGVPEPSAALLEGWDKLGFSEAAFLGEVGLSVPAGEKGRCGRGEWSSGADTWQGRAGAREKTRTRARRVSQTTRQDNTRHGTSTLAHTGYAHTDRDTHTKRTRAFSHIQLYHSVTTCKHVKVQADVILFWSHARRTSERGLTLGRFIAPRPRPSPSLARVHECSSLWLRRP
jgi:hypothetical protein